MNLIPVRARCAFTVVELLVATVSLVSDAQNEQPAVVGISFNGILNSWSSTAVARPGLLPLLWAGRGEQNIVGFAISNPTLRCDVQGPCLFNPSGPPQEGASCEDTGDCSAIFTAASLWVYGEGLHFVATDSSAQWHDLDGPKYDPYIGALGSHFVYGLESGGALRGYWICSSDRHTFYACMFRPDFAFENRPDYPTMGGGEETTKPVID